MKTITYLGAALALTSLGCTGILGDITFDCSTGGAGGEGTTSTSSNTGGSGGSTTSSSSNTGGSTTTSSSSSTGGGGTGGSTTTSSSSSTAMCTPTTCKSPATCDDSSGTPVCICPAGMILDPANPDSCIDDPCIPNPCGTQGFCTNDTGVAVCTCVVFVDPAAMGTGDGTSWANAITAIQPGIELADDAVVGGEASCEVWVKKGTYYLYDAANPLDGIQLRTHVGVYGGFAGTETHRSDADPKNQKTILSGKKTAAGPERVNHVVAAYDVVGALIDGFTIQDGIATSGPNPQDQKGGGVVVYAFNGDPILGTSAGVSLTVSRCDITGNAASAGGGVGMQQFQSLALTLTIEDSDIHGNTAVFGGGGVYCMGNTSCTVNRTTIRSNSANEGGGLVSDTAIITDGVTLADNYAVAGDGGGMSLHNPSASTTPSDLKNLTFSGNYATNPGLGGGLKVDQTTAGVTLTNAVFVGNTASSGGAVYDNSLNGFACIGCTITGNRGITNGDGIQWAMGAPTLKSTILWGNPLPGSVNGKGVDPPTWASVNATYSDIQGYSGTGMGVINVNPMFVEVAPLFDFVASFTNSTTMVTVTNSGNYVVGDKLEIGGDGVSHAVISKSGNDITFGTALLAPAAQGTSIRNWGGTFGTLDLHLTMNSQCVNTSVMSAAPPTDIGGAMRMGAPDMGAYESH